MHFIGKREAVVPHFPLPKRERKFRPSRCSQPGAITGGKVAFFAHVGKGERGTRIPQSVGGESFPGGQRKESDDTMRF